MRSRDEALELIERALAIADGDEVDATLVAAERNVSRFANSALHQNLSEASCELTVRVFVDGRFGVASTTLLTDEGIRQTAALARDLADKSEPLQGFRGLYRGGEEIAGVSAFDEETATLDPVEKTTQLRDLFERGDRDRLQFAGSWTTNIVSVAAANSHGVRRYAPLTSSDATVIAFNGRDSGYATEASRTFRGTNIEKLGSEASERATRLLTNRASIAPGQYDVILEPPSIAEVFEWMNMITFSGRAFEDGSSFFADHRDQQLLGANVTIADDAIDPAFLPFPFDMEGLPKRRVALIEQGTVRAPLVDKLYADRFSLPTTSSASGLGASDHGTGLHLSLAAGDSTREELIASTERGIWVTRFNYVNGLLDPRTALMTGMTRDGTFLIEEGRVTGRLPNLRWTQSMVTALQNVAGLSRERQITGTWWNLIGGTIAPVVKVRGWTINGAQPGSE